MEALDKVVTAISPDDAFENWPAMTIAEVETRLCAPGARFEMETVAIRGNQMRSWKNIPANIGALAREAHATHDAWFRATATLSAELTRRGICKGDRVAVAMRNLPEWPVAFFAASACGAIVVPLNAWWSASELHYGLANSGAKFLICDNERWQRMEPLAADLPDLEHIFVSRTRKSPAPVCTLESVIGRPGDYSSLPETRLPAVDIEPDDDATIFYTSGTSGEPKGALGTHRNMLTSVLSSDYARHRMSLRRGEEPTPVEPSTGLTVVPLFHVTACNAMMMPTMATGGTLVFMKKWDTIRAFELIERERVSYTVGVPTIAWELLENPDRDKYDLSSLTAISYGGAPASPELARRIDSDLGVIPAFGWGMTETSSAVTVHTGEDYIYRPTSCGPALPISELQIRAPNGVTVLPIGETGELWASGPQVVKGYWNNPEATRQTFVDGWVRTGDIARLDEEGFCYVVDRVKDVIIRGGENIYSIEVEHILQQHPAIADVAVVGLPHRTLGEEPAAAVHLERGAKASEAELQDWAREHLARFKVPVRILFCDGMLPRNANGKILKSDIRKWFDQE
jgi:acyl-CoA synthetase (AMP-forming)/AMP-acid ligase II